ncbi:hypothetical protein Tco_0025890 [Tanacetum coccineum]
MASPVAVGNDTLDSESNAGLRVNEARGAKDTLGYYDRDGILKRPTMYFNLWRYKVVRHGYSNPMIQPELEGSTQGYPLVNVEVLSHGPSDAMCNPSQPLKVGKTLFQNSRRFTHFYLLSHSELVDIEKVALSSSLRSLKSKYTIKSRAKKRSSINLIRTLMEILLEPTSNKLMVGDLCDSLRIKLVTTRKKRCDTSIDFQIDFSISIGETVTHWFTLIVMSTLRLSGNENMVDLHGFEGNLKMEVYLIPADSQDS